MKKIITIILFIVCISFTSCNSSEESSLSLRNAIEVEYDDIEYILLWDNELNELKITDSKDYTFLEKYVYKNDYNELHEMYVFPKTKRGRIEIKEKEENISIFILETGNIVYGTEEAGSLKEYATGKESSKEIFELYKKYGGIIE